MKARQFNAVILLLAGALAIATSATTFAQCTFTSGSTGADGDFILSNSISTASLPTNAGWNVTNTNIVTITTYPTGVFNFKSVYIETNWVVQFTKNVLNTPIYLLATTNVTINGTITVSGSNGTYTLAGFGGPGGYDGGMPQEGTFNSCGFGPGASTNGTGAGGGYAFPSGGSAYGVIDIQPFIGGSGGDGGGGYGAGGGGGAILIASSATITINGSILANGSNAGGFYAGSGSGGSIRLIAQTITGEGQVNALNGGIASLGRIRLEACALNRNSLTVPTATFGPPGNVFLATNPTIRVVSIAGTNTPAIPAGSLTVPDVTLPTNFVNPATISVAASNVTPGTAFSVIISPAYDVDLTATGALSGTYAYSTGTVSMTVYTDRIWRVNALIPYIPRH